MSSIPLGENLIPIQRGLTTSSTAIFIPFITQELFQTGRSPVLRLKCPFKQHDTLRPQAA